MLINNVINNVMSLSLINCTFNGIDIIQCHMCIFTLLNTFIDKKKNKKLYYIFYYAQRNIFHVLTRGQYNFTIISQYA